MSSSGISGAKEHLILCLAAVVLVELNGQVHPLVSRSLLTLAGHSCLESPLHVCYLWSDLHTIFGAPSLELSSFQNFHLSSC
jgi:hypothetical protein